MMCFNVLYNNNNNKENGWHLHKENRIYIREEVTRKKCKTAIFLYCFHTADVLHIFVLYNLLGPGINIKENQMMK